VGACRSSPASAKSGGADPHKRLLKGSRNNTLDTDCGTGARNARVYPLYGIRARVKCPACLSAAPKATAASKTPANRWIESAVRNIFDPKCSYVNAYGADPLVRGRPPGWPAGSWKRPILRPSSGTRGPFPRFPPRGRSLNLLLPASHRAATARKGAESRGTKKKRPDHIRKRCMHQNEAGPYCTTGSFSLNPAVRQTLAAPKR
jgi:hypothetical protein